MICTQYTSDSNDYPTNITALAKNVTDVTFDDAYHPQVPDATSHLINETEDSLSFEVGTSTLDLCRLNEEPDTLLIALSDDVGNFISNVKLPLALVQQYINNLPHAQQKAC